MYFIYPSKNAYYQRYSDDIIIVCDQKDEEFFYNLLQTEIEQKAYLEIQASKTNIYRYELGKNDNLIGGIVKDDVIHTDKQLEYLGFAFDEAVFDAWANADENTLPDTESSGR